MSLLFNNSLRSGLFFGKSKKEFKFISTKNVYSEIR